LFIRRVLHRHRHHDGLVRWRSALRFLVASSATEFNAKDASSGRAQCEDLRLRGIQ
jgi:hypothetical protein